MSFEFWGIDVSRFPALDSPVRQVPFTFSYFEYLGRLRDAEIDIFLCPLLDHPAPRRGKSLIKYFEAAVAGAVGVFSDVPPYGALPHGLTCVKPLNQSDSLRYAERWSELLGTPGVCGRDLVPEDLFRLGFERSIAKRPAGTPWRVDPLRLVMTGTLQPRKQQAEAIEAVGRLHRSGLDCRLDLYGDTSFFPEYLARCRGLVTRWGLEDRVEFHGFESDARDLLIGADVLLIASSPQRRRARRSSRS